MAGGSGGCDLTFFAAAASFLPNLASWALFYQQRASAIDALLTSSSEFGVRVGPSRFFQLPSRMQSVGA